MAGAENLLDPPDPSVTIEPVSGRPHDEESVTVRTRDSSHPERPTWLTRKGAAWSEVAKIEATLFRLRVGGLFRTAWLAGLCGRLAERRVSIDHAHARLAHDKSWLAELHLVALPGAPDPAAIPYVELAEAGEPHAPAPLSLDAYRLLESRDYGGTLMLALEAADSLGLLGSLLGSLAALALFPVEMHIETKSGRAYDQLWLAGEARVRPSAASAQALDRALARCLPR